MTIHIRALFVALVILGLLAWLTALSRKPPSPKAIDAPGDQFSATRAFSTLKDLLTEGTPHPAGSENNALVRKRIIEKLKAIGVEVNTQQATIDDGRPIVNVMCRLPGLQSSPAVMLVAHYDSATQSPGASDDGAGVAVVIEAARILKNEAPLRNPIVFLLTDGEEAGEWGAKAFVTDHPWAKDIGVVVNLEARGTSGRSLMFETSDNNSQLIAAYVSAVSNPDTSSLYCKIYGMLHNRTDLKIFKQAGMAGMNFAFIRNAVYYHTEGDNLEHLDLGTLQQHGDNALAMTRTLASMDLSQISQGDDVYTDLLGLAIIRWPERWNIALAIPFSLLFCSVVISWICAGSISLRSLIYGLALFPLLLLIPALFGIGLQWLLTWIDGSVYFYLWTAPPIITRAILWSGTLIAVIVMTGIGSRWTGCWGLWSALFIWLLIATWCSVAFLPCASYLFLIPLAIASVASLGLWSTKFKDRVWAKTAVIILTALPLGLIMFKSALGLEDAIGFKFMPGITAPLSLVFAAIAPLWMPDDGKTE
jgi:hypothetical protein